MKKNKNKEWLILILLICINFVFVTNNVYSYFFSKDETVQESIDDGYNLQPEFIGSCESNDLLTYVDVLTIENFKDKRIAGKFTVENDEPKIILRNDNTLVDIAHEASHFVDWTLNNKDINDDETRAYLQGYFTDCIYNVVKKIK